MRSRLRRKTFKYFISYKHENGTGRCQLERSRKINSHKQLVDIEKKIKEQNDFESIAIINYKLIN